MEEVLNAHHIVGDFSKTFCLYKQNLRISSIGDNGCYLTAAANDLDFSEIFSFLFLIEKEQDHIIFYQVVATLLILLNVH